MRKTKRGFSRIVVYVCLVIGSIFACGPIYWTLSTSFKTREGINSVPPQWLPYPLNFAHYKKILFHTPFLRDVLNTFLIAGFTIVISVTIGALAAYVLTRFDFKGRNILTFGILATSMMPGISTLPSIYMLATKVGLYDTRMVLILTFSAWRAPVVMWLLRGFFQSIPKELEESAMIDGCSRVGAIVKVIVPLVQPGLAAASLLVFVFVWNTWIFPAVLTISSSLRVVTVGLYANISEIGVDWGGFTAYSMLISVPLIVLFVLLQKRFIEGLTGGAVKG